MGMMVKFSGAIRPSRDRSSPDILLKGSLRKKFLQAKMKCRPRTGKKEEFVRQSWNTHLDLESLADSPFMVQSIICLFTGTNPSNVSSGAHSAYAKCLRSQDMDV